MRVVELSGGVGGARLARGLDQLDAADLTILVNVGDDDDIHGLHVSADLDTVIYTLAGIAGPAGWGRSNETFVTNEELGGLGADNRFRLGDRDLAMNILRTEALRSGERLSKFTRDVSDQLEIRADVMPATDESVRTMIEIENGERLAFQDYFVLRGASDEVVSVDYVGSDRALPAPGAIEAIGDADLVLIAPSNPPLSILPILAIPGYRQALESHPRVVAVSPFFGGQALKGPAAEVMSSLGYPAGNQGIAEIYEGLIDLLVVDQIDESDAAKISSTRVVATDTRVPDAASSLRLAEFLAKQ